MGAITLLIIAVLAICTVAIGGWAVVSSVQALAFRNRPDPELERRLDALLDVVAELRSDVDAIGNKQESDRQTLEERLDFAERLLTRGRSDAPEEPR